MGGYTKLVDDHPPDFKDFFQSPKTVNAKTMIFPWFFSHGFFRGFPAEFPRSSAWAERFAALPPRDSAETWAALVAALGLDEGDAKGDAKRRRVG